MTYAVYMCLLGAHALLCRGAPSACGRGSATPAILGGAGHAGLPGLGFWRMQTEHGRAARARRQHQFAGRGCHAGPSKQQCRRCNALTPCAASSCHFSSGRTAATCRLVDDGDKDQPRKALVPLATAGHRVMLLRAGRPAVCHIWSPPQHCRELACALRASSRRCRSSMSSRSASWDSTQPVGGGGEHMGRCARPLSSDESATSELRPVLGAVGR